jgi:hypothetical protein
VSEGRAAPINDANAGRDIIAANNYIAGPYVAGAYVAGDYISNAAPL